MLERHRVNEQRGYPTPSSIAFESRGTKGLDKGG